MLTPTIWLPHPRRRHRRCFLFHFVSVALYALCQVLSSLFLFSYVLHHHHLYYYYRCSSFVGSPELGPWLVPDQTANSISYHHLIVFASLRIAQLFTTCTTAAAASITITTLTASPSQPSPSQPELPTHRSIDNIPCLPSATATTAATSAFAATPLAGQCRRCFLLRAALLQLLTHSSSAERCFSLHICAADRR